MDTLIPVVIILAIVCFVGYKHREKISALYDKVQKPDSVTSVPELGTIAPNSGTPYKVEPAKPWDGEGDPPSQEAWTEWRNRQPASTRFAIPEAWKPAPIDNPDFGPKDPGKAEVPPESKGGKFGNSGFLKVGKYPTKWDFSYNPQTRFLCNFTKDKPYITKFNWVAGAHGITFTPSANNSTSGVVYSFRLEGNGVDVSSKSRPNLANYPLKNLAAGEYTLTVTTDRDCQAIVTFK